MFKLEQFNNSENGSNTPVLRLISMPERGRVSVVRRDKNRLHTMRAIYESALELFDQKGFEKTSIDEIAFNAGVSRRVLLTYFPTKESIAGLPLGYLGRSLSSLVRTADKSMTPLQALSESIVRLFEEVSKTASLYESVTLGYKVVNKTPSLGELNLSRRSQLYLVAWKALLERGVDPDDQVLRAAAAGIVACSLASLFAWLEANKSFDLVELTKSAVALLLSEFS